jgi:outer membrane protein TolC
MSDTISLFFEGDKMFRPRAISTLAICMCVFSSIASAQNTKEVKRLSLQDAIQAALANNLAIEIQRTSWQGVKEAGTLNEESAFEWTLGASARWNWTKTGSYSITTFPLGDEPLAAEQDSTTITSSRSLSASVQKSFKWGGSAQFTYSPSYSGWNTDTTITLLDYPYTTFPPDHRESKNPYGGSLGISYTQNLLKGFGNKITTAQLVIAQRGLVAADANFKKIVQDQVAVIETVYWNLVYAQMNLFNARQALDIANRLLRENQVRVETGVLAPIEITSSEASVAQREVAIIQAEAAFQNAKDTFVRTVYSTVERPEEIELTDAPAVSQLNLEEEDAIENAIKNRVELFTKRIDLQNAKLSEEVAHSNLKPSLSASAGYNGSVSPGPALSGVNSDLFGFRYPGYNVNLTFSMPLQNKSARASDIRARANRRTAELALKDQELAVTLDVRTAYRNLKAAEKSIVASEKSRILAQETYDAELTRLANGLSTNFIVMQRQNDLDSAKTAELNAKITYVNTQTAIQQAMGTLLDYRHIKVQ